MSDRDAMTVSAPGHTRRLGRLARSELEQLALLVDRLPIADPLRQDYIRQRWFAYVEWYHWGAVSAQRWYYLLRGCTLIGGVMVPALVSLNLGSDDASRWIRWTTFILSLAVAVSIAVEEFFRFGERWRHYRRAGELLKSEGWAFFQQSGVYARRGLDQGFPLFVRRVEASLRSEVGEYIDRVVAERLDKPDSESGATSEATRQP
jgi:hypothetical protein